MWFNLKILKLKSWLFKDLMFYWWASFLVRDYFESASRLTHFNLLLFKHGEQYVVTKSVIIKYNVNYVTSYVMLQRHAKLAAPILPSRNVVVTLVVPNLMWLRSLWSHRLGAYYKSMRSIFTAAQNFYRTHRRSNNSFLYDQVLSLEFRKSIFSC